MRDPGLVAVDLVDVAGAHRARLQRGEVGAGVRLGEHRGRQHLAGGDLRQPLALLLLGAAAEDQLGGDLRAGAERAHADIAARQLLRDHAHRFLAEPHAAELLGDGQAEHAELGHLRDDLERDVAVGAVPALRVLDHLAVGELAHLLADRFQRFVETAGADRRRRGWRGSARPAARGAAPCCRMAISASTSGVMRAATAAADRPRSAGRTISPWLIGMPPWICARYSPRPMRTISSSISVEQPALLHALGIGGELPHRFDIGRKPGEPVRGALLAVEQARRRPALQHHPLAHLGGGVGQQRLGRARRACAKVTRLLLGARASGGLRHLRSSEWLNGWRLHSVQRTNCGRNAIFRPESRGRPPKFPTFLTIFGSFLTSHRYRDAAADRPRCRKAAQLMTCRSTA